MDIERHPLKNPGKKVGISTGNSSFSQYRAAIAAGATLEELYKWRMGLYPVWFQAEVMAFYDLNIAVQNHIADANRPPKAKQKPIRRGRRRR